MGCLGRFEGGREFRDRHTKGQRFLDVRQRGIVVTGQWNGCALAMRGNLLTEGGAIELTALLMAGDKGRHLGIAKVHLALIILNVLIEPGKLPLAGRMIHNTDQAHQGIIGQLGKQF